MAPRFRFSFRFGLVGVEIAGSIEGLRRVFDGRYWFGFARAPTARGGFEFAGFVNYTGKFFDDVGFGEALGFGEVDEGNVGAAEEFAHFGGCAARGFGVVVNAVFEFDGADGTEGAFITEDEIDGFVFDVFVGGIAVLDADFVAQERGKANIGDDVEFLTKEVIEHLEALLGGADHKVLAGAVFEVVDTFALTAAGGDASKDGHQKEQQRCDDGHSDVNLVCTKKLFKLHNFTFSILLTEPPK